MDSLRRTAMRRGVRGGNQRWLAVWVGIAGIQLLRRILAEKPVVETFELLPGQTIIVRDLGHRE